MLYLSVDASLSVAIYVPFGTTYQNLKLIGSCKKWKIGRTDSYKQ